MRTGSASFDLSKQDTLNLPRATYHSDIQSHFTQLVPLHATQQLGRGGSVQQCKQARMQPPRATHLSWASSRDGHRSLSRQNIEQAGGVQHVTGNSDCIHRLAASRGGRPPHGRGEQWSPAARCRRAWHGHAPHGTR
jgi:hypothetical protein